MLLAMAYHGKLAANWPRPTDARSAVPTTQSYVCCDLTNSIHDVYVPWVTAGSLTLVLCLLASIRVITATVKPVGRSGGAPQVRVLAARLNSCDCSVEAAAHHACTTIARLCPWLFRSKCHASPRCVRAGRRRDGRQSGTVCRQRCRRRERERTARRYSAGALCRAGQLSRVCMHKFIL